MLVMPRTPTKSETAMQCGWLFGAVHARLFRDLAIAHAVGSLRSLLARLSRIDVLVVAVPPAAAVFSTIINLVNLWLAARVVGISGRLKRPWPDIAALTQRSLADFPLYTPSPLTAWIRSGFLSRKPCLP